MAALKIEARAFALMSMLLEEPRDKDTILNESAWSVYQFNDAIKYLRQRICPEVGAVLPRPVAEDGYCYHLVDAEHPNRPAFWRGSAASTVDADSRLRSILRDVSAYRELVDGRTLEGRKVRMIEQRVRHLVEDLDLMDEFEMNGASA